MVPEGKKMFEASERMLQQQAEQTIKGDPVLALVELVTNSDDSYRKMEQAGISASGNILIRVSPKRQSGSVYEIYDQATGMNAEEMLRKITKMGEDESGLTEATGGRSFFGRGLKECMIAFGKAEVRSIKNRMHYKCTSLGVHVDTTPKENPATQDHYRILQIPSNGSGTRIHLFAANEKLQRTPILRTLAKSLSHHYSLRDIMQNPKRNITLQYGSSNTKGIWHTKEERRLTYTPPNGELLLDTSVKVEGYPNAEVQIKAYRAEKEIPQAAERYEEERGFLICSKEAVHDMYHFGFANHEAANFIFGRVTCHYLDHLLRTKQEPVINSSRDGVKWAHHFCRALERTVEKELRSLFQKETEKRSSVRKKYENEETSKRVREALNFMNDFANEELEDLSGPSTGKDDDKNKPTKGSTDDPTPRIHKLKRVPNGFAFIPPFVRVLASKPRQVLLKVELSDSITSESVVTLDVSNPAIQLKNSILHVVEFLGKKKVWEQDDEKIDIVTLETEVSCDEVGTEGTVLAKCNGKEAVLEIVVTEEERSSGGLFSDYEFDPDAPPQQRVRYIRGTGIIKIATQAPSIVKYFGPRGEHQNTPEARSLLAELILEACCDELARLRFAQEGFFLIDEDPGSITAACQFAVSEYKNRLAENIHAVITNP